MIKVLIICKQLENAKKIVNNIVCKIEKLQLIGIANSFNEATEILVNDQADIIITTNTKTIQFIKNKFITYNPGVIIIDDSIRLKDNYSKYLLVNNLNNYETMINKIKFFLRNTIEQSQKEKLTSILLKLGFDFNLSGTTYLYDSIIYAHSFKGSYKIEKLKRDIYSYIAELNNTTSSRVKWSIERSIRYMYDKHTKGTYMYIEKYLNIKYPQRPTPKQIILLIANSLDYM